MPGPYELERIENWVADFVGGERARAHPAGAQEFAGQVLVTLFTSACDVRGVEPAEVEDSDLRTALLGPVAALELPQSVRDVVPDLAADFFTELEEQGRVADGRALGLYVRALRRAFRSGPGGGTVRRPAPKVGPNAPCPCGSGVKFKKCCRGLLD